MAQNIVNVTSPATSFTATNSNAVNATVSFPGDVAILAGVANTVGALAIGATAAASVDQTVSNGTVNNSTLPTNAVNDSGANSPITATNNSGFLVNSSVTVNAAGNGAFIFDFVNTGNLGNSIVSQTIGASSAASISSRFDQVSTTGTGRSSNTVNLSITGGGLNNILASNGASITANEFHIIGGNAGIINGVANTISASGTGATGSASISQSVTNSTGFDLTTLPTNTVTTGDVGTTAAPIKNTGTVDIKTNPFTVDGTADIGGGMLNSVIGQATGASAGASISSLFDHVGTVTPGAISVSTNSISTTQLNSLNQNTVQAGASIGAVADIGPIPGTNPGTGVPAPGNASQNSGVANTVGAIATGASAGSGITQTVSNSTATDNLFTLPSNTVVTGNINAKNDVNSGVTTIVTIGTNAAIEGGMANSIISQGTGATANASITSRFDTVATTGGTAVQSFNTIDPATSPTLTATNSSPIVVQNTASTFVGGNAFINGGIGNTIAASGVGASAGAGIAQSASNSIAPGMDVASLPNNSVQVGAITATNNAAGTVTVGTNSTVHPLIVGDAQIDRGMGNSIVAQGVGAAASASISSRFDQVATVVSAANALSSNQVVVNGAVVGANLASVTVNAVIGGAAKISTGVANMIGGSAIGGSASAGIDQSVTNTAAGGFDLTNLPKNTVTTGDVIGGSTVVTNGVSATVSLPGTGGATISNGLGNSIAADAVGSVANASISSRFDNVQTVTTASTSKSSNTVGTGNLLALTLAGPVTATLNIGSVGNAANAVISNGVSNSIAASAIGAQASAGIGQSVTNSVGAGGNDLTTLPTNTVTTGSVTAGNLVGVTATLNVTGGTTNIPTGMLNSVSAQAVGASAGGSIGSQFASLETTAASARPISTNKVTTGAISATNSGTVGATATFGTAGSPVLVSITGGVGNSIGASAIGASGAAGINQTVYSSTGGGVALGTLPSNTITAASLTSVNTGPISATLNILGTAGPGGTVSSIGGGMGNSITAQAIGASAGASISQHISSVNTK